MRYYPSLGQTPVAAARRQNRGAFFRSIHGTLNHIMVGDRIWMARFEGGIVASTGLDAILHDDFDELRAARRVEDARIEDFMAGLDDALLAGTLACVSHEGHRFEDSMTVLLPHFFNHQTHLRGQITGMLRQTGCPYPALDMHRLMVPSPDGNAGQAAQGVRAPRAGEAAPPADEASDGQGCGTGFPGRRVQDLARTARSTPL